MITDKAPQHYLRITCRECGRTWYERGHEHIRNITGATCSECRCKSKPIVAMRPLTELEKRFLYD